MGKKNSQTRLFESYAIFRQEKVVFYHEIKSTLMVNRGVFQGIVLLHGEKNPQVSWQMAKKKKKTFCGKNVRENMKRVFIEHFVQFDIKVATW